MYLCVCALQVLPVMLLSFSLAHSTQWRNLETGLNHQTLPATLSLSAAGAQLPCYHIPPPPGEPISPLSTPPHDMVGRVHWHYCLCSWPVDHLDLEWLKCQIQSDTGIDTCIDFMWLEQTYLDILTIPCYKLLVDGHHRDLFPLHHLGINGAQSSVWCICLAEQKREKSGECSSKPPHNNAFTWQKDPSHGRQG